PRAERPVAIESVGLGGGVQIVASGLGAGERPVIFLAPYVLAHHENLDRLLALSSVVDALQDVVVPAQHHVVQVDLGGRGTKVDLADAPSAAGVTANHHQQSLAATRGVASPARFDAQVIPER